MKLSVTKKILVLTFPVMLLLCFMAAAQEESSDEYQPGLLEEIDKREAVAAQEGIRVEDTEPQGKGLMVYKEKARAQEMEQERLEEMKNIERDDTIYEEYYY